MGWNYSVASSYICFCSSGKYRIIKHFEKLQFRSIYSLQFPRLNIKGNNMEELPEPEPNRPNYRCGQFVAKHRKAEKAINFFNSSRSCLDSLLKLLEDNKDEHEDLPAVLNEYNKIREKYPCNDNGGDRFPLIVLEGLDGSGKSTVGMRLAKKLKAERISTPPKSISSFREKFDGHYCLHAPFYYLGNYVAALEVKEILQTKPVVMDRFWHSTTAFALAQMKEDYFDVLKSTELPEKLSDIYKWPNDLLKPDIVLFLDVSEEERNNRLLRRKTKTEQEKLLTSKDDFRKSVLLAYDNMYDPSVEKINGNEDFPVVLQEIEEKIKHLL